MTNKFFKCINAKDKKTGADHTICPRTSGDMGKIVIVDDYRGGHKIMYDLKEVLNYSKENFKAKDAKRIVKMASKSFRLAKKSEKEGSGGIGYSKFSLWGKGKNSTSV